MALVAACDNKSTTPPGEVVPIMIATPDNGDRLTDSQTIQAVAGAGYIFTKVDFYIDTILVATDSTAPYQYFWNIFTYDPGLVHPLYVVADSGVNDYMSDVILVTLDFEAGFSFAGTYQPGSQNALGVTNYGNVLFISEGDAGVEMLDIRLKTAPQFLSRFDTPGQSLHADVLYPLVLIADNGLGLRSADFSEVDTMIADGVYTTQSLAIDVAVSDSFVFLAENDGFTVLEHDGNGFTSLGRRSFPQDILKYVVAYDDTAYVVGNNGFYIIDSQRRLVGSINNLNLAQAVAVVDTFAFIANGNDGVIALSIGDRTNPRFLARFNPGQIMAAVDAGDGVLFAGASNGSVYALNYSTPDTLIELGRYIASNLLEEIDYASNYLFVAAHTNVDILRFVP
ncbi:MAG: hypothetical protein A2W25_08670 [candidate division Zixibacteria bacterium RBG_16_53_22]|nr:MAG: hypothetical protein A2W25_08670 [candidate division Zixibacteria bacterium RBG_16_53_22]